jgi:hypothetical protein
VGLYVALLEFNLKAAHAGLGSVVGSVIRRDWNFAKSGKPNAIIQKLYRGEDPAKKPAQISPERAGSSSGSE